MFGVSHHDPFGKVVLHDALRLREQEHGAAPDFVAVEYDSDQFSRIRKQRPLFREEIRTAEPNITTRELDILEQSLVYEGDAHEELYPGCKTIWLDQGRSVTLATIENYASARRRMLLCWVPQLAGSLNTLSAHFRDEVDGEIDFSRSRMFYELVRANLMKTVNWTAVIVGRAHTNAATLGSMANLLSQDEVIFASHNLCAP